MLNKIIICGAGLGGLATALSLHAAGFKPTVYEAVPEIQPLGVGINVLPHSIRELAELGLLDKLIAAGVRTQELVYVTRHGQEVWREPRGQLAGYHWPQISIHRGTLQMILLEAVLERLGPSAVKTDHELLRFTQTEDKVTAYFGSRASGAQLGRVDADLLIAADGMHSKARAQLYPDEGDPIWSGRMLWRATLEGPPFRTGASMVVGGHSRQKWVSYPIRNLKEDGSHQLHNWIAELSPPESWLKNKEDWNREGRVKDFIADFDSWRWGWMNVPDMIAATAKVFEYPMSDRNALPRWVFGRVALLGDAAHPTYPIGSNGASQAILDARVLAHRLVTEPTLAAALKSYEDERLPITTKLLALNRAEGPDRVLQVVEDRHPEPFGKLYDVISKDELEANAADYKKAAGFDVERLNTKPSLSVSL